MRDRLCEPIKIQHEEIEIFTYPIREDGKFGKAIRAIAKTLLDHFDKEDEIVLPLLGILQPIEKDENLNIKS